MRHTTQLPTANELERVLAYEARRDFPRANEEAHYADFSPIVELMRAFGMDPSCFTNDDLAKNWLAGGLSEGADPLIAELVAKILGSKGEPRSILDSVYDYLSEEDPLEPADAVFVFGAKTPLRAQKAIELYQGGHAPKLVFSGHGPFGTDAQTSEAEAYRDLALAAGVPAADVIIETESVTIPDNVRASLNLFEATGFMPKRLILVNSPYVQRRGWCHFKKYLPEDVVLIRQNCTTGDKFSRDGWFTNADGIKVVLNEFFKMKIAVTLNTA